MIPFEVEEGQPPQPVPSRERRRRYLWFRIRQIPLELVSKARKISAEYPNRIKIYSLVALLIDYIVTNVGLSLIQHIHLTEQDLANKWQHIFPVLLVTLFYSFPAVGIFKRTHLFILVYVILTVLYLIFSFAFTVRVTYKAHYSHYHYRVHYCPTKYASSDAMICIVSILKGALLFPVFRYYVHSRECMEFHYYKNHEDRNNYGLVELPRKPKRRPIMRPQKPPPKPMNLATPTPPVEHKALMKPVTVEKRVYENAEVRSVHSSSFASTLDLDEIPIDFGNQSSESEEVSSEESMVLGDIEEEEIEDEEFGIIRNRCFRFQ